MKRRSVWIIQSTSRVDVKRLLLHRLFLLLLLLLLLPSELLMRSPSCLISRTHSKYYTSVTSACKCARAPAAIRLSRNFIAILMDYFAMIDAHPPAELLSRIILHIRQYSHASSSIFSLRILNSVQGYRSYSIPVSSLY